jgi:hypothetical protein
MPSENSKHIVYSDLIIDNRNRIVYCPNGLSGKGYIMPDVDSVTKFRKIGEIIQWINIFMMAIFWVLFYMQVPILIILISIPTYIGTLLFLRYQKLTKPLRQFEVSDEKPVSGIGLRSVLGSINGFLFWTVEIFFLILLLLGLSTIFFKPEKLGAGLFLAIFSGFIATLIFYFIFVKNKTREIAKRHKQ